MNRVMVTMDIWGDYACFTRPDAKVERVTYDIMTPSAARGALEAVFWKPEIKYSVVEIHICKPIQKINVLRNEIKNYQNPKEKPIVSSEQRVQRNAIVLTDVYYRIKAWMELQPHATDPIQKYKEQFERKVSKGQCFKRPFLGTREFSAYFSEEDQEVHPVNFDMDLGVFLYDIAFVPSQSKPDMSFARHDARGFKRMQGFQQSIFLNKQDSVVRNGILRIPTAYSQILHELERGVSK